MKNEYQQFRSFLKEHPTDELYSEISDACDCSMKESEEYVKMFIRRADEELLNAIKAGPFAKRLLQQILTDMHEIEQDNNFDYDCIFALIPYAYAGEKTSILKEELLGHPQKEIVVSSDMISFINTYFGELDESI